MTGSATNKMPKALRQLTLTLTAIWNLYYLHGFSALSWP